jgi:hypothetical protein
MRTIPLLLLVLSVLTSAGVFSFTPKSHSPTAFARFGFAENGVCKNPRYFVTAQNLKFTMRNVPGDGDCMFLAVALATLISMGLVNLDKNALLESMAEELRAAVSQVLQSPGTLVIDEDQPPVTAKALLQHAVEKEKGIETVEDYLDKLEMIGRMGGMYGGGPELTVLANILRRPISIYELCDDDAWQQQDETCLIECKGTFGSDVFSDPLGPDSAVLAGSSFLWHLHVLVLDASPQEKHACVLLAT